MTRSKIFGILLLIVIISHQLFPCTTGLADNNFTSNKRALLWKNRDSSHDKNEVYYFDHGEMKFIGIINNNDTTQVWSGVNNYGFAIMNSESRDLISKNPDSTKYDDEGYLMKEALETCKTLQDFEMFLESTNREGRKVTSNFGVIDGDGNAAYFETGNNYYQRYDAKSDYLIRANFSMQGRGPKKYGLFRYLRAKEWFEKLLQQDRLNSNGLITNVLDDALMPPTITAENFIEYDKIYIYDSICRYSTVSASVVEGIKTGETPEMTTFWCNLGHTASSVAIPLWVYSESVPACLDGETESELNRVFRDLEDFIKKGEEKFINPANYSLVRAEFDKLQQDIIDQTNDKLAQWRNNLPARSIVADFQNKIASAVLEKAKNLLSRLPQK